MNGALLSSKKMDYCTPQGFFDTLNAEFHFTLDAAATEKSAKCKQFYTPETDGLTAPWNIGGAACFATRRMAGHWARGCAKPKLSTTAEMPGKGVKGETRAAGTA